MAEGRKPPVWMERGDMRSKAYGLLSARGGSIKGTARALAKEFSVVVSEGTLLGFVASQRKDMDGRDWLIQYLANTTDEMIAAARANVRTSTVSTGARQEKNIFDTGTPDVVWKNPTVKEWVGKPGDASKEAQEAERYIERHYRQLHG